MRLQVALEYMVIFAFVILIFMLIFVTVAKQRASISNQEINSGLQLVAADIASQLNIAAQGGSGYSASVSTPVSGSLLKYSLNITRNGQVIVSASVGKELASAVSYSLAGSILSDPAFLAANTNDVYSIPISNGTISLRNSYGTICVDYMCPNVTNQAGSLSLSTQNLHVASFNGNSSYVSSPLAVNEIATGTITAWIYPESFNGEQRDIVSSVLYIDAPDHSLRCDLGGGDIDSNYVLSLNTWQFVACSFNGSSTNFYVNGRLVASKPPPPHGPAAPVSADIGGSTSGGNFAGLISNLQFYNTSLGKNGIAALYSSGIGAAPLWQDEVGGWYTLNGNTYDYSGWGRNGAQIGYLTYPPVSQLFADVSSHSGFGLGNTIVGFASTAGTFNNGNSFYINYTNESGIATAILTALPPQNGLAVNSSSLVSVQAIAFEGNALTQNSLVAWYPLSLGYGATAADISGSNDVGTVSGASWNRPAFVTRFEANSSVVGPILPSRRSVSLWLKTNSSAQQPFFSAGAPGSGTDYELALVRQGGIGGNPPANSPGLYLEFGGDDVYIPVDLVGNGWHNVVASWNGATQVNLSVDGVLPAGYLWNGATWSGITAQPFTLPSTPSPASNAIIVGGGNDQIWNTGLLNFNGTISNVQVYSSALTRGEMAAVYYEGISGPPTVPNSLLLWWPLNGDSLDYSGNGNGGAGFETYPQQTSALNSTNSTVTPLLQATFDGNANIVLGNSIIMQPESFFTVGMWINASRNGQPASPQLLSEQGTGGQNGYEMYLNNNGKLTFTVKQFAQTWGSCSVTGGLDIEDGMQHFVTGVYSVSNLSVYVDGEEQGVSACTPGDFVDYSTGANGIIGNGFVGNISGLQAYSTALSPQSVKTLYLRGRAGFPVLQSGLVGWYPLDGDVSDYSPYGTNATQHGIGYTVANATYPSLYHALGGSYGMSFNGKNSKIVAGGPSVGTGTETQAAWVYLSSLPQSGSSYQVTWQDNGLGGLSVDSSGNVIFGAFIGGILHQASASTHVSPGEWYFISGNYSGTSVNVCVNAGSCGSAPISGSVPSSGSFDIGSKDGTSSFINGSVANVQVYGSALNSSQIFRLYHNEMPPSVSTYLSMSWLP